MKFWYQLCWWICRIGLFFWHPVFHTVGRELVPNGTCILCANHSGMADPLWILLALREPEMIRIIAKQELRSVPFVGWVMEKFRIIFVRRGAHDAAAYESCVDALKNEHDVRPKTGAVRMALASGAPVVPVFVTRNRTPFCPVRVIFGEPYPIANIDPEDHTACQQAADALLKTIYQLGGDAYADQIGKDSGVLLRC